MQGAGRGQAADDLADGSHFRIGKLGGRHGFRQPCPALGILRDFLLRGDGQHLAEEAGRLRFYQYGQGAEEVGHLARRGNVPMLLGRIAPQILLQPFGEDMPAAGNHQVGAHRLLCFRAEGGQQRLDIADGHPGMVGGMGGEASEGVLQAWGKCLARIALPDKQHPAGELPQVRGQFLEMVVFAGDDPGSGQGLDRAVEERLADGDIDMHGTPAVVTGLQQGLVDEGRVCPSIWPIQAAGRSAEMTTSGTWR